jgi:hypothetical protein
MAYRASEPRIGTQPFDVTETVQKHALGTCVRGEDPVYGGGEFIYLKGVASTVVGSMVDYDRSANTTTLSPATLGTGQVAVAMSANVLNQFGWYQIAGVAAVKSPNATTVDAEVWMLAATPGSVDDAVVAGEQILNAQFLSTTGVPSAGLALIQIQYPFHQGGIT